MILQKSGQHCYVSVYQIIPEDVPKVFYKFRKHDRKSMGYLWLSGYSQVDYGLGDHFAITVAHLSPKCALSVVIVYLILFVPLYIIVMPYLRHCANFVPKICEFVG